MIDKQLKAIDKIAQEFPPADAYGQGIHERLEKARSYYADLRTRMAAEHRVSSVRIVRTMDGAHCGAAILAAHVQAGSLHHNRNRGIFHTEHDLDHTTPAT